MTFFFSIPEEPNHESRVRSLHAPRAPREDPHDARFPYRHALRAIGNALDTQNACRIHIMELLKGFLVRFHTSDDDPSSTTHEMAHADLARIAGEMQRTRRLLAFSSRRPRAGYESLLRTLGRELDIVHASNLLIDEIDDGLLVTYNYEKPGPGKVLRKHVALLEHQALEQAATNDQQRRADR